MNGVGRETGSLQLQMMKRIANMTRADFLLAVEERCPSSATGRAIQDGNASVLGLFTIPEPVWIIQVEQKCSVTFLYVRQGRRRCGGMTVRWMDELPPWSLWIGDEAPESPINQGDIPGQCKEWKKQHGQRSPYHNQSV